MICGANTCFESLVNGHHAPVLSWFRASLILALLAWSNAHSAGYQIGVYYFPGWRDMTPGAPSATPWKPIKEYPEREPLLGWYNEGSDEVMAQQLQWMQSNGISFVVFDWYFVEGKRVLLDHALKAYLRAPNRSKTKFSILWANHSQMPRAFDDWQAMVDYWIREYFSKPEFLKIDGLPVVFIFSADVLEKRAATMGLTTKELLSDAQDRARKAGGRGIYFVAGTGAAKSMIEGFAKASGYSAFSAYNYHSGAIPPLNTPAHSFQELDLGYQQHWKRFSELGNLPLIVPITSGWDQRPWGGSKDPRHDECLATPEQFENHLAAAKTFMDANKAKTNGFGVICCWNEFGEGSFIEPTKMHGFQYLERIKKVFATP